MRLSLALALCALACRAATSAASRGNGHHDFQPLPGHSHIHYHPTFNAVYDATSTATTDSTEQLATAASDASDATESDPSLTTQPSETEPSHLRRQLVHRSKTPSVSAGYSPSNSKSTSISRTNSRTATPTPASPSSRPPTATPSSSRPPSSSRHPSSTPSPSRPPTSSPTASASYGAAPSAQATGTLVYYGGPVIQSVRVIPIYYTATLYQTQISTFYSAAVSSNAYFGLLSQYHTTSPAQSIGFGTAAAAYVAPTAPSGTITDAQIQSQLTAWINAGAVPAPTANTYYPIHFPPGVTIDDGTGSLSCSAYCGYHGTFSLSGQYVYYGVLPDLSASSCSCWGSSTVLSNVQSVASHELFETVTDPAVGLACCYASPLGWYSSAKGEIGDICAWQMATVTLGDGKNYVVQKQWSDVAHACTVA